MSEARQVVRKIVEFNLGNPEDYLAWEYAKGIGNFSGSVKQGFAAAEKRRRKALHSNVQSSAAPSNTAQPKGQ